MPISRALSQGLHETQSLQLEQIIFPSQLEKEQKEFACTFLNMMDNDNMSLGQSLSAVTQSSSHIITSFTLHLHLFCQRTGRCSHE